MASTAETGTPARNHALGTVLRNATPPMRTPLSDAPRSSTTESPGNWQHPRLKEIKTRQARLVFDESNIRVILINVAVVLFLVGLRSLVVAQGIVNRLLFLTSDIKRLLSGLYTLGFLPPLWNIFVACLPLLRRKDDFSDIALTREQREMLGLPPTTKPPLPSSQICTPPRYSRTPSLAGSSASVASSALSYRGGSNKGSPAGGSPMAASPLRHKAVMGPTTGARRLSLGSPSGWGRSSAMGLGGEEGAQTPSPAPAKRASLGLTKKWLYEKGRRSSSNSWQQQMQRIQQGQES